MVTEIHTILSISIIGIEVSNPARSIELC